MPRPDFLLWFKTRKVSLRSFAKAAEHSIYFWLEPKERRLEDLPFLVFHGVLENPVNVVLYL